MHDDRKGKKQRRWGKQKKPHGEERWVVISNIIARENILFSKHKD
jgi:hypothetical protein